MSPVNLVLKIKKEVNVILQSHHQRGIEVILPSEDLGHDPHIDTPLIIAITGVILETGPPVAPQRGITVPLAIIEAHLRSTTVTPLKSIPLVVLHLLQRNHQRILSRREDSYLVLLRLRVDWLQ